MNILPGELEPGDLIINANDIGNQFLFETTGKLPFLVLGIRITKFDFIATITFLTATGTIRCRLVDCDYRDLVTSSKKYNNKLLHVINKIH